MEYQQCGPLCPQTCDYDASDCYSGCVEGCFCPIDKVLMGGECINKTNCPGKLPGYLASHVILLSAVIFINLVLYSYSYNV